MGQVNYNRCVRSLPHISVFTHFPVSVIKVRLMLHSRSHYQRSLRQRQHASYRHCDGVGVWVGRHGECHYTGRRHSQVPRARRRRRHLPGSFRVSCVGRSHSDTDFIRLNVWRQRRRPVALLQLQLLTNAHQLAFKLDARQSPTLGRPAAPLAACIQRHAYSKTNKMWLPRQRPLRDR